MYPGPLERPTTAPPTTLEPGVMPTELTLPLIGLALLDSTSFGTLLIPLWLMLAPGRLRPQRVLVFLGTVAGYYLVLGIALLAGAVTLADRLAAFLASPAAAWAQLVLGVGLFVASFAIGRKDRAEEQRTVGAEEPQPVGVASAAVGGSPRPETPAPQPAPPGRAARWRARAMGEGSGVVALMGLALAAAAVETASMVPYLSAIGLITAADLPMARGALVLAGYCLVMIAPALVLLAVRVVAYRRVRGVLQRLEAWLTRTTAETTAWIIGIVGFLLARDAIVRTGLLDLLGSL